MTKAGGISRSALLKRRAELASSSFTTATGQNVMAAAWDNAFRFQSIPGEADVFEQKSDTRAASDVVSTPLFQLMVNKTIEQEVVPLRTSTAF